VPGFGAFARSLAIVTILATTSLCQIPAQNASTSQIQKEFVIGRQIANDLERRDGKLDDNGIIAYVQRVSNRVAAATGVKALEIRVTRSPLEYAHLLPTGTLYISGSLLERIASEAELAGLIAHQLAHGSGLVTLPSNGGSIPLVTGACVLASPVGGMFFAGVLRDGEIRATATAVDTLQRAGYDPTAMLELLSKLSYEHPAWSKAIVADDLLSIRATVEPQTVPAAGYEIDSSAFIEQHKRLAAALGHAKKPPRPTLEPSLIH
jgi:predicted Zn-dependent protease